jgi:hypothetical protein
MAIDVLSDDICFAEALEAAAFADFFAGAPPDLARAMRIQTVAIGAATALVVGAAREPFLNRVMGLGVHAPATEADLDRCVAVYRDAGAITHWIHLTPGAQPSELRAWLERRGYTRPARWAWAKMVHDDVAPPAVATTLEVRRAKPEEHDAVAAAVAAAFGMPAPLAGWFASVAARPAWRTYAALDAGRVVGGGFLYLDARGAWLGAGGVQPEFRGRHAQRALMALRIREAVDAGCARIATETGEPLANEPNPSLANMAFCGFRKVCSRLNYAAP